jgi:hypothetical protein
MSKRPPGVKKHERFESENEMTGFDFTSCFRNDTESIRPLRIDMPHVAKKSKIPYVNETKNVHAV